MHITNHLLDGVTFKRSPNIGGMMTPTGVIMHYTAGFTASSAINTLCNPAAQVSAHLVIDRDGTTTQLVPFNRVAWHAGPSVLDGIKGCNNFCIGFEFVNPGYFRTDKFGKITDADGHALSASVLAQYDMSIRAANARVGGGIFIWPAYPDKQIAAGLAAFEAICTTYKITHLAGHEEIDTRKWKTDPGVAFPMGKFKQTLHGGAAVADRSDGVARKATAIVIPPKLNVRDKASIGSALDTILTQGSEVVIIHTNGDWTLIEFLPGKRGYVSSQYLKKE